MKTVSIIMIYLLTLLSNSAWAVEIESEVIHTQVADIKLEVIAKDLETPWGFAFLPNGDALVGERAVGRLSLIDMSTGKRRKISGLPKMLRDKKISAGLFDILPHPRFDENQLVYLVHSVGTSNEVGLAISQGKLMDDKIVDSKIIFETQPRIAGKWHFGGRLVTTENYLYLSTGDGYEFSKMAQDLSSHLGKILRLKMDGTIPSDNPFVARKGALGEIWSYGVRNPQGLAVHPVNNRVWEIEHGPQGGDEINIAEKGKNYGWPTITYGEEYGGGPIGDGLTHKEGMEQPLYYWVPSIAPSGATFYLGERFPKWQGNLFVGALAGTHLSRLVIEDKRVLHEERILDDKDWRIRFVKQGPDAALYIGSDTGQVIRITNH